MKIYIAGPMRGKECFNFESFFYMARRLKLAGHEVINPAQVDVEKMLNGWVYSSDQYNEVLFRDLELIKNEADALLMLEDWRDSPGAGAEYAFAKAIDKIIIFQGRLDRCEKENPFSSFKDNVNLSLGGA